jgi:hypothetical protein
MRYRAITRCRYSVLKSRMALVYPCRLLWVCRPYLSTRGSKQLPRTPGSSCNSSKQRVAASRPCITEIKLLSTKRVSGNHIKRLYQRDISDIFRSGPELNNHCCHLLPFLRLLHRTFSAIKCNKKVDIFLGYCSYYL